MPHADSFTNPNPISDTNPPKSNEFFLVWDKHEGGGDDKEGGRDGVSGSSDDDDDGDDHQDHEVGSAPEDEQTNSCAKVPSTKRRPHSSPAPPAWAKHPPCKRSTSAPEKRCIRSGEGLLDHLIVSHDA